jgi:hypothetical protein
MKLLKINLVAAIDGLILVTNLYKFTALSTHRANPFFELKCLTFKLRNRLKALVLRHKARSMSFSYLRKIFYEKANLQSFCLNQIHAAQTDFKFLIALHNTLYR